ncbi:hypothetical protein AMELA_G00231360 [Ameiurus melas]|uniref:Uncharacterized protein n=1 Tax=Ameiurus melas TaxID=219545 RepID=A0A7J6A114_AMEME|nr:hypothetical protein AMELA_G00231360 [Ameiurus melas]
MIDVWTTRKAVHGHRFSGSRGSFRSVKKHHGGSRLRHTAPVHRHCQVLQLLHHHRKEELCLGHIREHRRHYAVLQTEAQEEGCNGELMYYYKVL